MVAWLISQDFFMNFKNFYKQCGTHISRVQNRLFISSECPFHTLGPVLALFSSIHHYIIFLWLQRSIGQPKVIFFKFKNFIIKKRITKKKI